MNAPARRPELTTYEKWQRTLLPKRSSGDSHEVHNRTAAAKQKQLVGAARGGPAALAEMLLGGLGMSPTEAAALAPPPPAPCLTAAEMQITPPETELRIAHALGGTTILRGDAASPAFWAACHAHWMVRGMFGDNLRSTLMGDPTTGDPPTDEKRVRNLLRRIGGLRTERGNVSPITNCPISAAWWKRQIALMILPILGEHNRVLTEEQVMTALRHPQYWWEELVERMLKRAVPAAAHQSVAAAVWWIHKLRAESPGRKDGKELISNIVLALARLSHSHSLHLVPFDKVVETVEEALTR